MAITITWTGTLTEYYTHYKTGSWYDDGVYENLEPVTNSGTIQTPLDADFNQILSDEELIIMLEPLDY